jgi:hypothetical protein
MSRGTIRIVQRGQQRVVREFSLAREWNRSIVNNGVGVLEKVVLDLD